MLAQEVLHMRGTISREHPWEVMPDLSFYRNPEETEKEEQAAAETTVTKEEFQVDGRIQLLSSLPLSLGLLTGLKACRCPLYLCSSSLLKTGALSLPQKTGL
ncbi:hypothetical protein P7K49_007229 [Saguinus oedipus]|uniref:Small ribosomal subunit protein uS2 C-terminal domain-containing protein n=1 Tax=Saguinus oedipus TaxID=9490 RepID=A0ABQ9VU91_SAGOE|nr:hypothetical protein P7K49_007229 [Saguinus oedipus]